MNLSKVTKIALLLMAVCTLSTPGIMGQHAVPANIAGRGNAAIAMSGSGAYFVNPAGIMESVSGRVVAFSSMPFGIPDLTTAGISTTISMAGNRALAAGITSMGIEGFHSMDIGGAFAMSLFDGFAMAIDAGLQMLTFDGYRSLIIPTYGISARYSIPGGLGFGVVVSNPVPVKMQADNLTRIGVGLMYEPLERGRFFFDVEMSERGPPQVRLGCEIQMIDRIVIRAGTAVFPTTFHVGFGLAASSRLTFDLAMSYHAILGITPGIGITFTPGEHGDSTDSSN